MRRRKKGSASLEHGSSRTIRLQPGRIRWNVDKNLLETRQLFVKEVNHHGAKDKAGEDGEDAGDACREPIKNLSFV